MKNIRDFCDSCLHEKARADEEPCQGCMSVGLKWGEPVSYIPKGMQGGEDE